MRVFKKILIALLIFVAIPAGILAGVYFASQKHPEIIDAAMKILAQVRPQEDSSEIVVSNPSSSEASSDSDESVKEIRIGEVISSSDIKRVVEQDDNINKIPLEFVDQSITARDVLSDKFDRIGEDFDIPISLRLRTAFWFDIYTKYSSHFSVIHDITSPWIVYKVVDLRDIYDRKINRIAKATLDRRRINEAKNEVRAALTKLSKKRNFKNLSAAELKLYKLFENVPGNKKKILAAAAKNVRDQRGQKNYFRSGLIMGSKYINEMETIFAKHDLPIELCRVPLVESSFNELAQSKVGASGVWQFMPWMGKQYMHVGEVLDERNSPIKSTDAAAKLMLSNFQVLKTWPLAISAFNHGAGGLIKATKQLKTKNLSEIIAKYKSKSFGFASQNYYTEFLAALYAERYQDEIFGEIAKHPPLLAEEIKLPHRIKTGTLIDILGLTMEEFRLYNPDLKNRKVSRNTLLPSGYRIRVPQEQKLKMEAVSQLEDESGDDALSL